MIALTVPFVGVRESPGRFRGVVCEVPCWRNRSGRRHMTDDHWLERLRRWLRR